MERIKRYDDLLTLMNDQEFFLLYVTMPNCSICHADQPKVAAIVKSMQMKAYTLNAAEVPEAAGQLSLFAAPVVLLYLAGREIHRQARIIDFDSLEKIIGQVKDAA